MSHTPARHVSGAVKRAWRGLALGAFLFGASLAPAATSAWVYPSPSGRLIHQPDALGNRIVDHAGVGYQGGTVPLPTVPVVLTISPVPGDNQANIQNALDQIAAMTPDTNGFRGALLLNAGVYAISNSVSINASGIVMRGVGNDTNGTVLYSTSTNGPDNGQNQLQGLVVISGSYSPIPVSGTSNNVVDNYVPVGARSFMVDGAGVLNVGDHVIIHRPSTANWITAIGMDQLNVPWQPSTVDVDEERIITRIEGSRVMIDEPITTALDQNYGGGSIYAFTWPQRYDKIGIENLRGQSYYNVNNTNDEDHAWIFLRFSNTEDCWVRNVVSQFFGKSCVSLQTGVKHATVINCQCLDPISIIESERRYAFDLNSCQLCLVANCFTRQDRHSFITQSLTDGPNVFVDGLAQQAYDLAGPHVRWASGILFDNVITDNGMTVANQGNSGASGHGWCGANCVIWDSTAAFYTVEGPPTAHNWLIGSNGPLQPGGGGNAGPHGPGTYDSLGTNVFPNSLYYAQLQDRIAVPHLQTREYRLGSINQFSNSSPAGTSVPVDPAWSNLVQAAGAPLDGFDIVTNHHWVPFTFNFALATNERVVSASLSLSMLAIAGGSNDMLYLDSLTNGSSFAGLGWLPVASQATNPTVEVLDLSSQLGLLADGQLNVAIKDDIGVDWAMLEIEVAPILTTFTNSLAPVGDATVRGGIYATNSYGSDSLLTVNETSLLDNEQKAYLHWDLSGISGTILQAKVRLTPINVGTGGMENGVTFASTDTWSEAAITWSNQPGGGKRFATWIPKAGTPVEFTIPPQMMDAVTADNQLSLQVFSLRDVGVQGSVDYAAREYFDPGSRPQLLLTISNTVPTLSLLTDLTIFQDTSTGPIPFTIGDAESAAASLLLTSASSNPTLVPAQNIVFGGSGANRTVTVTPAPNQTGAAVITVAVTDPGGLSATDTFMLTVAPYTNASFLVSAAPPAQTVSPGSPAAYSVGVATTNGFTNTVSISVSGLPTGASASFTPPSINGSGSSTLNLSTSADTPAGTYTLTIAGAGGGLNRSTTVTLNVSGFLLTAGPAAQTVPTNSTTSFAVSVTATNGFGSPVALSVSGLPGGATAAFTPASLTGSGLSTLNVTNTAATPTGIYPLTITGTGGGLTRAATVMLNVFDFTVSASPPAQGVTTSAATSFSVAVAGTPGISNTVLLSVSGLPPGASASFSPPSVLGSGSSTLTIATSLNTPPSSYNLAIIGTSGGDAHTNNVALTVTDFGLAASPGSQTIGAGAGTNYSLTLSPINGFSNNVALSVSGLPAGTTGSFTPASLQGSGASTFTLTTSTNTPAGSYTLAVTGTSGTLAHTTNLTLNVASFALAATPQSRTVSSGGGANFTATVTAASGFTSNVVFSVSGLPAAAGASFSPASVNGSGSSTLSVTTSNTTPAGNYILTVSATSGAIVQTATVTLKVNDFSVAATPPSQSVTASVGTSFTVAVTTNNGFGGTVVLSVGGLPAGAGATFNPSSLSVSGTSTLSITTSNTTPGGSYTLTITGTSGSLTRSTNVTLNVTGLAAGFVVAASPSVRTVAVGDGTNYNVSVNGANGFSGAVALSASGLPTGTTASFNPASVTGSGNSTLTVTTTSGTTPTGVYPFVITGISGTLTNSATNTLDVFDFSLSSSPQSRTVLPGDSDTFTATVTGTSGITNLTVGLSLSGLPINSSASYSPASISGSGTSTLTVFTSNTTPAGTYTLTLTATFGGLTRTATATLRVKDFYLTPAPGSRTVAPGNSTNYSVTITPLNTFSGTVTLVAGGLPSGATASFNPASVTSSGTSTLTVTTATTSPGGTYNLTISGISGDLTRSTNATLVVASTNHSPVLSPISNQTVNAGILLTITNVASDPDSPPQTLAFSLLSAPTGALVDTNTGVLTWRPPVARTGTSNFVSVKVADNGTPPLSATQGFAILVNPLAPTTLRVVSVSNGLVTLSVAGAAGPDYSMQASTNLAGWATLFTTNSPMPPFTWKDTNAANFPWRYYRALLGP